MELQTQHAVLAGILGAGIAAVLISDIRSRGLFPAGRKSGGFRIPVRTLKYVALVAILLAVPAAAAQALEGEGAFDSYPIVVSDDGGEIVFSSGGLLDSGNFQIHATNQGHP